MSANKTARLVIVKNPFQAWNGRIVKEIPAGTNIRKELVGNADIGCEIYTSVNGRTVAIDDYEVLGGEIITVSPIVAKGGGGKILGLVAMVALAVVSYGVFNAVATSAWVGAYGGLVGGLCASAVMMIGGQLINRAFFSMPTTPSLANTENESTYGWSGVQTLEGQNNATQMTYGKVKSAGQTIGKYVQVNDNKEYLNWLIACGEGELTFSNILINDNPYTYYEGMSLETRPGTNNQSVIQYFNDTYFTKSLGYEIRDNEYRLDTAQGNGTQGLIVKFEFSRGLYHAKDDGSLENAWVDIYAEYRKIGGSWQPMFTRNVVRKSVNGGAGGVSATSNAPDGQYKITYNFDVGDYSFFVIIYYPNGAKKGKWVYVGSPDSVGDFTVNVDNIPHNAREYSFTVTSTSTIEGTSTRVIGNKSSAIRKEYRINNLSAGEYEVRVKVTGRSHKTTDSRASVACYWSALTSIVYDDFAYPNIALIGVRALATDQINGSPTISFIKERKYVWVYNPNTKAYEQKPANNPAWASYDMLHLCSRLYNVNTNKYEYEVRGVPAKSIIYEQFNEWAKFCDSKKYYVNIEIGATEEMLNCINDNIACIGHGLVIRFGTKYGCVWYCAKQPVQMFGMGNIISGTFKEDFLETTSRANALEITYIDADHDFSKETITIYGDNYDTDAVENATQVTYNGITSYSQAFREGKYNLYCNKYQLRTVSFEANIDAIACTIGDVILVAHDVPQWTHSGRIYDVDIENGIFTLPVELKDAEGNLRLMYRTVNDKLYTVIVYVLENENGWCKVQGTIPNTDDLPQKNDIFDIGLTNIGSKPFIVTNITRAQDFTRVISGVEYIEQLYTENYDIPPINYSESTDQRARNVTGLSAEQITYTDANGVKQFRMFVSWEFATNGGRYTVLLSKDKTNYEVAVSSTSSNSVELNVEADTDYYVKVITTLGVSKSSGTVIGKVYHSVDRLPPNVKHLDTEVIRVGTRRYFWDFEYPNPNDIAGFRMKFIQGNTPNWEKGNLVQEGLITVQPYETTTVMQGVHTIMIKAVDNAGQESASFASCIVDFGEPLEDNVLWKMNFLQNVDSHYWSSSKANHWYSETNFYWSHYKTNGVLREDGCLHAKQNSYFWQNENYTHYENSDSNYWSQNYEGFYLETSFIASASGWFFLEYDIEGTYNISYKIEEKDNLFKPYSTRVYVKAGETITVRFDGIGSVVDTVIKRLFGVIDVPDRQEHFENIQIVRGGTELPIKTLHYYTTSVAIDSISIDDDRSIGYFAERISNNPCVIKVYRVYVENNNIIKEYIDCNADITWQGFERELLH